MWDIIHSDKWTRITDKMYQIEQIHCFMKGISYIKRTPKSGKADIKIGQKSGNSYEDILSAYGR